MSYQVLARKWRPKSFDELVGQQQTAKALINALESQRLHHAYLFTGTRGVGKTTIARILSKSLNCETGITSKPCGECSSCVEIDQGNFVDLMEIDAASKTKVEDTRELLDNVQYRPSRGRYKVYLIDEVHMLSGHSFNALLKTLEEPPPHVVFLLATTDPQKLPVTVLSRCLQFHLKRMEIESIINHLSMILNAEQIVFEESALAPIAKGADGSMRDALSLLDQAIAYSGQQLTETAVLEMLGSLDQSFCISLLERVNENDPQGLIQVIAEMSQYSPNFIEVMSDWLSLLHRLAVYQATGDSTDEDIIQLSATVSPADLQLYYQLSLQAKKDLAYAPSPRQGFEMALLRVLAFRPQSRPSPIGDRTSNQSSQAQNNNQTTSSHEEAKKKLSSASAGQGNSQTNLSSTETPGTNSPVPDKTITESHSNSTTLPQHQSNVDVQPNSELNSARIDTNEPVSEGTVAVDYRESPTFDNDTEVHSLGVDEPARDLPKDVSQSGTCNVVSIKQRLNAQQQSQQFSADAESLVGQQSASEVDEDDQSPTQTQPANQVSVPTNDDPQLANGAHQETVFAAPKNSLGRRLLYPDEARLNLEQVNPDNWHVSVDQMEIGGTGFQVLINALGHFRNDRLEVEYLERVTEFLTDNLTDSLVANIRKHFAMHNLKVEFKCVEQVNESPKEKQVKIHKAALENAYLELSENLCFKGLQQRIGASIDKQSIRMK
jgi:DNA polymerase-3 subunit gamma/tau